MTAQQLAAHFARSFGIIASKWPETYEVDAETYGNCCQAILDNALELQFPTLMDDDGGFRLKVAVGRSNGLMFKNVELIMRR